MKLPSRRQIRQLECVVANHPSGFFDLAAAPRQPLAATTLPTSPRKTRVGVFRHRPSGQTSSRRRCRSMFTPGSRPCGYKTASGRHELLNQDPIQERGGINLYRFVGNNPINFVDPYGLSWFGDAYSSFGNWELSLWDKAFVGGGGSASDPNSQGALSQNAGYGFTPLTDANGNQLGNPASAVGAIVAAAPIDAAMWLGGEGEADAIYRGSKLARNCEKAGKPIAKGVEAAHHIVAQAAKLAEPARQKLAQFGIDIDDAANGIGLAKDFHQSLHTDEYYEMVNEAASSWSTADEAVKGLNDIANTLLQRSGKK